MPAQHLAQILPACVHDDIRVQAADGQGFFLGANGGDDPDAEGFRHGDDHTGQAAVAAGNQQGIAGLDLALNEEVQIGGGEGFGHGGSFHHGAVFGNGHQHIVFDVGVFGVSAAA